MHSPGVCGAILAIGAPHLPSSADAGEAAGRQGKPAGTLVHRRAEDVGALIDALNADTEMVLVAAEEADALAPAVWARAAYLVQLSPGSTEADGLRALLQETLSRGRDAVLLTTLGSPALTAETVREMLAAYRAAGDEIWAIVLENVPDNVPPALQQSQPGPGYPVLLGRRMIELFLRGREWRSAQEVLSANREHVRALNLSRGVPNEPSAGSLG